MSPEIFTFSLNLLLESPFSEGHQWRKGKLSAIPVGICLQAVDCTHFMPTLVDLTGQRGKLPETQ